jgi:proline racemase/trans-L-3-hydroxyproline dehydratase
MRFEKAISVVDSHTAGMPTRVVIGGFPYVPGNSMFAKMRYARENLDDMFTSILWEPRGHDDMVISVILSPVDGRADLGVLYRGPYEYYTMCGLLNCELGSDHA